MQASEFKARCLALLDDVAATGDEVVVTKHGVPLARLVPVARAAPTDGSVTLLVEPDELYSTGEVWDAQR